MISYIVSKKAFHIFWETELAYISGEGTFYPAD